MNFAKMCIVALSLVLISDTAFARGGRRQQYQSYQQPMYQQPVQQSPVQNISYQSNQSSPIMNGTGGAQAKADQMARMNSMQHLPGGFGGGAFEGVGFGSTREQAITVSCFWGQRTPVEIGAAQGSNGWYACVFYR